MKQIVLSGKWRLESMQSRRTKPTFDSKEFKYKTFGVGVWGSNRIATRNGRVSDFQIPLIIMLNVSLYVLLHSLVINLCIVPWSWFAFERTRLFLSRCMRKAGWRGKEKCWEATSQWMTAIVFYSRENAPNSITGQIISCLARTPSVDF